MANVKISQLPSLTSLSGTDVLPVVSGNVTYNVTAANIAALATGGANTGNVTFDNNIILGTGDEFGGDGLYLAPGPGSIANSAVQYLRVRGGDYPTHIHLDTGNNEFYDQYFGADNRYVKLEANGNIVINADDYNGNSATWTMDITGNLTLPGNSSSINYANGAPYGGVPTAIANGTSNVTIPTANANVDINVGEAVSTFDSTGNLVLSNNFVIGAPFGVAQISAPNGLTLSTKNEEPLSLQAVDNDNNVNSSLTLDPNNLLTRLEGFSGQDSNSWTTADWASGEYTTEGGGTIGAIKLNGAPTIIDFVNSIQNPEYVFVQVNGGPLLASQGWGGSSTNITFYVAELPATDPTTVTDFAYYFSVSSFIEMDYDAQELNIEGNGLDLTISTRDNSDLEINSIRSLNLIGNGSYSISNFSTTDGIEIQTNAGGAGQVWNYGNTGILTLPGEGVIQSNDDTIILQSKDTGTGNIYSLRVGTNGGLYFANSEYPGGWLDITNDSGNANITSSISTGGTAGYNLTITAGATNQGVFTSLPGGNLNLTGGTGGYADDGIGGAGGDINITAGSPGEPGNVAGNITVNTGTNTWTFNNAGSLSLATVNDESVAFIGSRKLIGGLSLSSAYSVTMSAGGTPTVAYTALAGTQSVKVTFVIESSGSGFQWEQFDVVAVPSQDVGSAVNFVVSNRVKGAAAIPDTVVTATMVSNQIQISLTLDAAQTSGGTASFDATEFGLMVD